MIKTSVSNTVENCRKAFVCYEQKYINGNTQAAQYLELVGSSRDIIKLKRFFYFVILWLLTTNSTQDYNLNQSIKELYQQIIFKC